MLKIKDLSKKFSTLLFQPISFELSRGEILQITGKNGVGKTTFLKCLAGYLDCEYSCKELACKPLKITDTAFASTDDRSFFPKLTIKENLVFFKNFFDSSTELAPLIESFQLSSHIDKSYQECSTGFRKRMSLIRAIIKNTPILLFDEPFANLDPEFQQSLESLFLNSEVFSSRILIFTSNNPSPSMNITKKISIHPFN